MIVEDTIRVCPDRDCCARGAETPRRAGRKRLPVDHITLESLQQQGLFDVPIQVRPRLVWQALARSLSLSAHKPKTWLSRMSSVRRPRLRSSALGSVC